MSGAPPPAPEAPPAKRQRVDFVLQPEDEFLAQHPGPAKVGEKARDLSRCTLNLRPGSGRQSCMPLA